jgi:hypothetical protein
MSGPAPAPPSPNRAPAATTDLSEEIVLAVDKRSSDRVTCRRIVGDKYRCNWWAPAPLGGYDNPGMSGLTVTTHRVRQSRFFIATKTAAGLVLAEAPERRLQ